MSSDWTAFDVLLVPGQCLGIGRSSMSEAVHSIDIGEMEHLVDEDCGLCSTLHERLLPAK